MIQSERWNNFANDDIDMCGSMSRKHLFFSPCEVNGGIRYNLRHFKKPIEHYSKRLHVGMAKTITEYGDLAVKNNTKVS